MKPGQVSPSNDFTDKVMANVKKRPRKIGLWNLVYFVPVIAALLLITIPSTQESILKITSKKHVAVASAQDEVDGIYQIMTELEQFNFDAETEEIISDGQN